MGNNLITAKLHLRGTRPMLWHRFGPDSIPLEKQERTGVAGNDPEEWKKTVLFLKDTRQLFIEPTYIFGCCRDGAKYTKKGKASLVAPVSATLQVVDTRVLVDRFLPEESELTQDQEAPVYLDVRSVRNPSTGARNVRYRVAASPGWNVFVSVMWDKTIISRSEMEAVAIDAGRLIGLGDGRKVGFGRFDVVSFEVSV